MSLLLPRNPSIFSKALLASGAGLFLVGALLWLGGGARSGFYQTSKSIVRVDPVTELEYQEFRDTFLPGIETLGLGFLSFVVLYLAASAIERRGDPRQFPETN